MCVYRQKIKFILHVFLEILQMILQTYFGYFGHTWLHTPKVILSTCRKLSCLPEGKKINFIPHIFLEILQIYAKFLFWVLWVCLLKTSIFICMPKINFIIQCFLEILHFKESCNLIGQQHFGP